MKSRTGIGRPGWWVPTLVAVIAFFGCTSPDSGVQETPPEPEDAAETAPRGSATRLAAAMNAAIQDEHRAQATYAKVLADLGDLAPFNTIVTAEGNHILALAAFFDARGWKVPDWTGGDLPTYASRLEACEDAWNAEDANADMYDALLLEELSDDVATVFANLRAASFGNHMPAFQTCIDDAGEEPPPPAD